MNPPHKLNMDPSLTPESANMQTQYASFQNFEQFSAAGFTNTPIYITKSPAIGAISKINPHCSVIGSQNKIETISPDIAIPGIENSLTPAVRYLQSSQFDDASDYGVAGISCAIEPNYTDESIVPYCYTSEVNFQGIPSMPTNLKPFTARPFDNNLNGTESVLDSQCRAFDNSKDYKIPQFDMTSISTVPPRLEEKEEYIGGSENDICSAMRWRDPNLSEVISFLSNPNNTIKANAAAYLQHLCYMDDPNKQRTRSLGGIPPLIRLLSYDSPEIHK